jgi:1-deoxy-D-xylulose-5-phosphate reductoisomerase
MSARGVALIGSTGSIGEQTLEVVRAFRNRLRVVSLAAGRNVRRLAEQAAEFRPEVVAVADPACFGPLSRALAGQDVQVLAGLEGLEQAAGWPTADIVVAAAGGVAGLGPVLAAVGAGKTVALANKEPLVAAGEIVTSEARAAGATLLPIDSELSAIFQALQGEDLSRVSRIILTASGGPFRGRAEADMAAATVGDALAHPTWRMGPKVTIDSATLMNKGFEIFEARWLFGVQFEQIEVVVHPQSIVHSLVEFVDGSVIAQLGLPDMRLPIQYALLYPERVANRLQRLDLVAASPLTFEKPDLARFPCLRLAMEAGRAGGTMPAVLDGADEAAVSLFMDGRIRLTDIPALIEATMAEHQATPSPNLQEIADAGAWARASVRARVLGGPA